MDTFHELVEDAEREGEEFQRHGQWMAMAQ